ncbi:MAG: efflux RND transporter periplasmic adaptor subunit [Muribaculum sp.]|nr:efflux RND transporter periplasmic adaptor subunit [Muribaculum sp.]
MNIYKLTATGLALLAMAGCSKKEKITLETARVEKGEITETVTATGTVESVTQVDVGTQVTGIVDKLYADYNSVVHKGELIAEIEKTLLESELRSADANMESARLTYEYNKTNYERDKKLHDKQLISDYEYQTSLKDYEVSKTAYEKAQADRVRAAKNVNYAEIYSPIDGVVISREVEVGQTVVSSMNVANLYVIADLDNMQVVGNVDEADIGQVKLGQNVVFTVEAYPDHKFEGHVTQVRLNPTTESNVVTYEVVVAAPNPDHKLIPGLTANLTIYVTQESDILTLPNSAFQFSPRDYPEAKNLPVADTSAEPEKSALAADQKIVWKVSDNKLLPTTVTVGVNNRATTQIVNGLNQGDVVALGYEASSNDAVSDGQDAERSPFAPQPPNRNKKK